MGRNTTIHKRELLQKLLDESQKGEGKDAGEVLLDLAAELVLVHPETESVSLPFYLSFRIRTRKERVWLSMLRNPCQMPQHRKPPPPLLSSSYPERQVHVFLHILTWL